tara:strand:+ start:2657 stop:4300 length:1644 start_codon:yes stop_codon:yes gene_type:complete
MSDGISQLMNTHTQTKAQQAALQSARQQPTAAGENRYLHQPEQGLKLCAELIANSAKDGPVSQILDQIQHIIEYQFLPHSESDDNTTGVTTYVELNQLRQTLHEVASFPHLARSYTLAVGGSFSAGKSRFLNSVLGCPSLLPTDTTPTTSIPTYLSQGEQDSIHALNFQRKKTLIDKEALKAICHAFNKRFNVTFSHLLQLISVEQQQFKYPNLIFLDTPGYSKSDDIGAAERNTDENISRQHLRGADYLVWLVDQQNGTLPQPDIEFIQSLELDQPILVVISKADKKPAAQIREIIALTRQALDQAEIDYVDVIGYSAQLDKEYSDSGAVLNRFLAQVDQAKPGWSILWQAAQIFKRYSNHYDSHQQSLKLTHTTVNELIFDEGISDDKKEHLKNYQRKTKAQLDALFKQKQGAEKIASELSALISSLCKALGINTCDQPNSVELKSLRKKQQPQAAQQYHFDALLQGDIMQLSKHANLNALPGLVEKISAAGALIKINSNLDIFILKNKIVEQIGSSNIEELFTKKTPVTVQILDEKECIITIEV